MHNVMMSLDSSKTKPLDKQSAAKRIEKLNTHNVNQTVDISMDASMDQTLTPNKLNEETS